MLNWRRDPGYEQRRIQHELRMKQLESEILQLRRENARLATLNARTKNLLSYVDQHCFPDEYNSTPLPPTEPGSSSS
jgi:hypothetical protein